MTASADDLLAAVRAAARQPDLEWARPPEPLSGGFWAEISRVRLATDDPTLGGELVARVMPQADVAAREIAVQTHLAASGYPTPTVRLSGEPAPPLDRAWMLMDFVEGSPMLDDLSGPSAIVHLPRLARSLPDRLARHAAGVHRIDPKPLVDLLDSGSPLEQFREQADTIGRPDLVATIDRVEARRPAGGRAVVCHGDLHPFNILSGAGGDTVLDWSASRIADPAHDLAYTGLLLANPPLAAPPPLRPVLAAAGRALNRRFTATYNKVAERPVDPNQLAWHTDAQSVRVLVDVATWEANDELDEHPGHPYLVLAPVLAKRLSAGGLGA